MKEETVNDIIIFYKTIGALDELSERQLVRLDELNTVEHNEYLDGLCEKYNVEYELSNDLTENILEMEGQLKYKFKEILLNC